MVDKLTSEEREVGQSNYYNAVGSYYDVNRRDFLRGVVSATAVGGAGIGAAYFGYNKVKVAAIIGKIEVSEDSSFKPVKPGRLCGQIHSVALLRIR